MDIDNIEKIIALLQMVIWIVERMLSVDSRKWHNRNVESAISQNDQIHVKDQHKEPRQHFQARMRGKGRHQYTESWVDDIQGKIKVGFNQLAKGIKGKRRPKNPPLQGLGHPGRKQVGAIQHQAGQGLGHKLAS